MKITSIAVAAAMCIGVSTSGASQAADNYPAKPVHMVVPQPAGGTSDTLARMWAEYASKRIGQSVIVENKPGANGSIAASYVARRPADGYWIFLASVSNMALNPFIYKSLPYSPTKDFEGVGLLVETPYLLLASKQSGINTFKDLVSQAKAKPGSLNFASAGQGNGTHLVMEMLMKRAEVKLTHIPYNGSVPALASVVGGQTDVIADVLATGGVQAKAGKATPLAVLGTNRSPSFPNTPTLDDLGIKDFPYPNWYALVVPSGTPQTIVEKLNSITIEFLKDPIAAEKLASLGVSPLPSPPDAVEAYTQRDTRLWGPVISELGIAN